MNPSLPPSHDDTRYALEERIRFEALLSDLSAAFVNVPASEVDKKIEAGLKCFADFLGFERGTVFQFSETTGKLCKTHQYLAREVSDPPTVLDDVLPMWVELARSRNSFFMSDPDNLTPELWRERKYCVEMGIRSLLFTSLSVGGVSYGLISFVSYSRNRDWPEIYIQRIQLVAETFANVLVRRRTEEKLHHALAEVERLKNQVEAENVYLRDQIEVGLSHDEILGESEAIKRVLRQLEQVAGTDSTVLITGETGTGKELVAKAIHKLSARGGRPMIKVNCAAIPSTLIESELFGREKGAYSGAFSQQIGRFEAANGSTIFLDEVGEMPPELQAKLLRVLQEGQFERLGSTRTLTVDARVVAATNRDLENAVKEGRFRGDLYYRLNVFPIRLPSLRERREDIPILVWSLVREFSRQFGKHVEIIPRKSMNALVNHSWPGNVRELRNLVERAMILTQGPVLTVSIPQSPISSQVLKTLDQLQRDYILMVLEQIHWRIRGPGGAAEILGMKPTTLESRMKRLNIQRPSEIS